MKKKPSRAKQKPTLEERFEHAAREAANVRYELRLYVSGTTPQSQRAVANTKRICEKYISGHYVLEVIDVYQAPERAKADQIFAAPTLVKVKPAPVKLLLGDMSDEARVMRGLNLT